MRRPSLIRLARKAERAERWRTADALWWLDDQTDRLRNGIHVRWWRVTASAHDAATWTLRRLGAPDLYRRNHDKPHRCPGCHLIECDQPKRWLRLYVCRHCDARHWPGLRWQRRADACEIPERRTTAEPEGW